MSQPAITIIPQDAMVRRAVRARFDLETVAKLLHGETTLSTSEGVFACERRPRTTTGAPPSAPRIRDGYLGVVTI